MIRRFLRWLHHEDAEQYGPIPERTQAEMLRDLLRDVPVAYKQTQPAHFWKLRLPRKLWKGRAA